MDTQHIAAAILHDPDKAEIMLVAADNYLRMPSEVLFDTSGASGLGRQPWLKSTVERFHDKPDEFIEFVKSIRDDLHDQGFTDAYSQVNKLYRLLLVRQTQDTRRERLRRALEQMIRKYGKVDAIVRQRWELDLSRVWAVRRLAFMEDTRRAMGVRRLSTDERYKTLVEFWEKIDREIEEGKLPPWPRLSVGATPRSTPSRTVRGGTTSSE